MTDRRWHPVRLITRSETRLPLLHRVAYRVLRGRFDELATRWDAIRGDYADSRKMLDAAFTELDLSPTAILDLGTGTGQAALHLASRFPGASVDALDASPAMISVARAKPGAERVAFLAGDAGALPYADASFDVVVSLLVQPFPHEALRVLRPGGWALFAYPMGADTPIWFPASLVAPMLEHAGFAVVRSGSVGTGEWTAGQASPAT